MTICKIKHFSYDAAPDLLVITCIDDHKLGQFILPKEILLKEKILRTQKSKRRRCAMRSLSYMG